MLERIFNAIILPLGFTAFWGLLAKFFFELDQKAITKGNYIKGKYSGKMTIWGLPFYACSIIFLCCIFFIFFD